MSKRRFWGQRAKCVQSLISLVKNRLQSMEWRLKSSQAPCRNEVDSEGDQMYKGEVSEVGNEEVGRSDESANSKVECTWLVSEATKLY